MAETPIVMLVLGYSLSVVLYGILLSQASTYYRSKFTSNDKAWTKWIVAFILIVESAMILFDVAVLLSPRFNPTRSALGSAIYMILIGRSLGSLSIGFSIGILHVNRLDIAEFSVAFGTHFGVFKRDYFGLVVAWLSISALVDIALSACLTYFLLRRRTGFERSDRLVMKIVRLSVEAGIVTSVCALLDLVFHVAEHEILVMFIPDLMLSKLYANSLLASLNAREKWVDKDADIEVPIYIKSSTLIDA
ncbi:hypothetical protein ONZ45_g11239 [Pleurotus djamor]|nr:hypothetical protein ONZ45_g11239 [Pleurotus djamor]